MRCPRCGGLMQVERARERKRSILLMACLLCGHRHDDTIWFNRSMSKPETSWQRNERVTRELLALVQGGMACRD